MTVYSELLRGRLEADADRDEPAVADLVADVVSRRSAAEPAPAGSGASGELAHNLDYDAALVRLCRRLGLGEQLTGSSPPRTARRMAEEALVARLPGLADTLSG